MREAVRKAEEAAKKAADESAKHGDNAAELRVAAIKAKLAAQYAIKQRLHATHKIQPPAKSIRKWGHLSKIALHCDSTETPQNMWFIKVFQNDISHTMAYMIVIRSRNWCNMQQQLISVHVNWA